MKAECDHSEVGYVADVNMGSAVRCEFIRAFCERADAAQRKETVEELTGEDKVALAIYSGVPFDYTSYFDLKVIQFRVRPCGFVRIDNRWHVVTL